MAKKPDNNPDRAESSDFTSGSFKISQASVFDFLTEEFLLF